jgi:hypothetical protein
MDRWQVPTKRALAVIGHSEGDCRSATEDKPHFALSDEQAEFLSCLLEIDLTLTVASVAARRHRRRNTSPMAGRSPLDLVGTCDPRQAATVLWSLHSGSANRRPRHRGKRFAR